MPGISAVRTTIPFSGGGGVNWDAVWASLISATVEQAAPTNVVLTFSAAASTVAADITATVNSVARAVSSASWTGAVWTVVLASAVVYGDVVVMTFVPSSGTASVTNNVLDTRFKITVDTTKAGSADTHFVLPVTAKSAASYFVDWGEGGAEEEFTTTGNKDHTYAVSGTYQVKVRGGATAILFANGGDKLKLISIDNWGNIAWSSMNSAFYGCANMTGTYTDSPNTSAVTTMIFAFAGCVKFNSSVAGFNTGNVTNMSYLFYNCTLFNQSVANFNTAKVTTMEYMFYRARAFNQSVANFNTSLVTLMNAMFFDCDVFNQSVANFDTSKVTTMEYMIINNLAFKQSLATFSLAAVTNINLLISGCNINATGTTTNYDATLVAWGAAAVPNTLTFHGGASKYSAGAAADARAHLVLAVGSGGHGWTITDGGQA